MELKYKTSSVETRRLMSKVILGEDLKDYRGVCESKVSSFTGHDFVKVLNSGNSAILFAMSNLPENVIVPDQGGWRGFKQAAKLLGKNLVFVDSDDGLINLDSLVSVNPGSASLFLTSFAGYTAEQDIKSINGVCRDEGIILVEDVSGSIGDSSNCLCNGTYSDVIVCSTGSPKMVNVGMGGFVSTSDSIFFENSHFLSRSLKGDNVVCAGIYSELDFARDVLSVTLDATAYLKGVIDDLTDGGVFHRDSRGVNVIFSCDSPKSVARELRGVLSVEGRNVFSVCPSYDRLKSKGVCLELKNISHTSLFKDNLDDIVECLKLVICG